MLNKGEQIGEIAAVILIIPLMILNLLGGLVGGIWMLFLGEWKIVLLGVGISLISSFALSVLIVIGASFGVFGAFLWEKKLGIFGVPFFLISVLSVLLIMGIWSLFVLVFVVDNSTHSNQLPIFLLGYGVLMAPWSKFLREEENKSTALLIFGLSLAFVVSWLGVIYWGFDAKTVIWTHVIALGLGQVLYFFDVMLPSIQYAGGLKNYLMNLKN